MVGRAVYHYPDGRESLGFEIEFLCCGARQVINRERLYNIVARPVKSCFDCRPPPPRPMPRNGGRGQVRDGDIVAASEADAAEIALDRLRSRMSERRRDPKAAELRRINAERVRKAMACGVARGPR